MLHWFIEQFKALVKMFKHIYLLFFDPQGLIQEAMKRTPNANLEKIRRHVETLRTKIFTAFWYAFFVFVMAWGISFIYHFLGGPLEHHFLIKMRWVAYGFILWGVLSPASIETWQGDTLPEVLNDEWHRLCYAIGAFLLMLSYLLEHGLHG